MSDPAVPGVAVPDPANPDALVPGPAVREPSLPACVASGQLIRIGSVDDFEPGKAKRIDVEDHRIAVVRIGDAWYAIGDECSHADYSLSEGEVDEDECAIECWKHGSLFSLATGEPLTLPATKPVPTYELTVTESEVSVTLPAPSDDAEKKDDRP